MIKLSYGEWRLMNRLWDRPGLTIAELGRELAEETGWTRHTIITMLSRMEAKGAVRHEEQGRAKHFYSLIERKEAALEETESFLKKVYSGSLGLMMSAMVQDRGLSRGELDELYEILKQAEAKKDVS